MKITPPPRLTPRWLRRRSRHPAILAVGLTALAGLISGSALMLTAGPAAADTLPAFDFTSTYPNCVYSAAGIGYEWAQVFTTGTAPVEVTALNAPAGVTVEPFEGFDGTDSLAVLSGSADVAPGVYTIQLEATNSAGSVIAPFTLVAENGVTSPTFLSSGAATATAGTAFSYQPSVASCPPVGGYTITGEDAATASWLSINTHTGLLSGAPSAADAGPHTFTLNANLQGDGGSVSQTFTLTVNSPVTTTAPGAPTIGTATPGNGQATVDFTAPASDGGSPVTGYTVTATDLTNPANGGQAATGKGSPITVAGLTNGDRYTLTVTATNAAGTGPASAASGAVIPATVPGAPGIGTATAGNGRATVTFTPPASDGGRPVTWYMLTATNLTNHHANARIVFGTASPVGVTGLTNGDTYSFTVRAENAVGFGPGSAPSNAVTPEPTGRPEADLSVAISGYPSARDGSTLTEKVTVTNHGPWRATGINTTVAVPGQLGVIAAPGGRKSGSDVTWTGASLWAGQSVTYTITLKVDAGAHGTATIRALANSLTVTDPSPRNNTASTVIRLD